MATSKWVEPEKDARFLCDDGVVRTWGELVKDMDADVYPQDERDYDLLMFCFGAEPVAA